MGKKIRSWEKTIRREKYREYLKTDHWKEVRLRYLKKNCGGCGGTYMLQLHHLNYDHLFAETELDLITLCKICHQKIHRKRACRLSDKKIRVGGKKSWRSCKGRSYRTDKKIPATVKKSNRYCNRFPLGVFDPKYKEAIEKNGQLF